MNDFLRIMTPFLLASTGGLYTELSGNTNVAIEGYITMGAFIFISAAKHSENLLFAVAVTLLIISVIAWLHSYLTLKIKANPIITSLAVNMIFFGLISTTSYKIFNTKGVIPLENSTAASTWIISIIAITIPLISYVILKYTRYGLRLKANGINPKILCYSNVSTGFYTISAMIISAVLSATAGIFLAMELRSFIPNISSGRGWISLVIVFLGRKNPFGIIIGCSVFTLTQILSNLGQTWTIPSDIVLSFPYILTLIALILSHIRKNRL